MINQGRKQISEYHDYCNLPCSIGEKKVYELQLKSEVKAGAQELLVEKYQFFGGGQAELIDARKAKTTSQSM